MNAQSENASTKLARVTLEAQSTFWSHVAEEYSNLPVAEFPALAASSFTEACEAAVAKWVKSNTPIPNAPDPAMRHCWGAMNIPGDICDLAFTLSLDAVSTGGGLDYISVESMFRHQAILAAVDDCGSPYTLSVECCVAIYADEDWQNMISETKYRTASEGLAAMVVWRREEAARFLAAQQTEKEARVLTEQARLDVREILVSFVSDGVEIINPWESSCGRFAFDMTAARRKYGTVIVDKFMDEILKTV